MEPSTGWWELGEERGQAVGGGGQAVRAGQAVREDEWRALLVPLPREEKGVLLLQVPLCPPALAPVGPKARSEDLSGLGSCLLQGMSL